MKTETERYHPLDPYFYDRRIFCCAGVAVVSAIMLGILCVSWGLIFLKKGCDSRECTFLQDTDDSCLIVVQTSHNTTETCLDVQPCPRDRQKTCYYKPEWDYDDHPCYSFSCTNTIAFVMVWVGALLALFGTSAEIIMLCLWYGTFRRREEEEGPINT
jgi:hypothetical protein